ncbi:YiiX/YebB-like N1pC/P60 family cysteine hydrolase [Haloferula sp.]|uniref:YiiX/YebB-like N1pC/P60 family cysteine hydrolase n=1 Tax=Haloferula sp. TaxID=2497595 RepID=UPI003C71BEF8
MTRFGRFVVWFYYSPVRIIGRDHIPQSGPLLLVANHANSLFDPVLVGLTAKRRVCFLSKAPLFQSPFLARFMLWIGMIPVYRRQDDPGKAKCRLHSLAVAAESLSTGSAIGIFPEGKSHDQRTLTDIFGSAARLVQQAVDAGATDLKIVPVGINFYDKRLFRSAVWIEVGPAFDATSIIVGTQSIADERRALTAEIAKHLREAIIHLDDHKLEPFLEDLEILDPATESPGMEKVFSLQQRKNVADGLNYFRKIQPSKVESVGRALVVHRLRLRDYELRVGSDILNVRGVRRLTTLLRRSIWLTFGLIPVVSGVLQNILPLAVERLIVRIIPQTGATTVALSRLVVAFPVFLLWYAFTWWLMVGYFLPWVAWFWVLLTPFAGLFALRYLRNLRGLARDWLTELRMLFRRDALKSLRATQERLRQRLGSLSKDYSAIRAPLPIKPLRLHERKGFRLAIVTGLFVLIAGSFLICAVRVGFRDYALDALIRPAPDYQKTDVASLEAQISADERRLSQVIDSMATLDKNVLLIKADIDAGRFSFLNDSDNDHVSRQLLTYLNCRRELLELILRYRAHRTIADSDLRLRASLVDLTAGCTLYRHSSRLVAIFRESPDARRKLNEGEPSWGIPSGIYDNISANLLEEANLTPFRTALAEHRELEVLYEAANLGETSPQAVFHRIIHKTSVAPPAASGFLGRTFHEASELRARALYHGQSAVSRAVGNTRVRERSDGPRVHPEHIEKIRYLVKPGDILLERQDWFLSRAFMPGYWAHAALYIGTPEEVEALGLATHPWVAPHWEEFKRLGADGHQQAIIEAVPEGVRFTTLEHCLGVADSAAVLRPALNTESDISEAITRAFHHLGKSYDFEFDFFSADKLVCTELVVRAYAECPHLDFPLVNVMGRQTLPPTEIARKFSSDRRQLDPQLELLIFLDGHAHQEQAAEGDADAFVSTIDRPGMTWFNSLN